MAESHTIRGYAITAADRGIWLLTVGDADVPLAYSELKQLEACGSKKAFDDKLSEIRAFGDLRRALADSAKMRASNDPQADK